MNVNSVDGKMFCPVAESGTRRELVPDCVTHIYWYQFLVPVSGKYVMGITIRAKMIGGGHPLLYENLGILTYLPIFHLFLPIAPQQ